MWGRAGGAGEPTSAVWSRRKLLALLAGAAGLAVLLLAGVALAAVSALSADQSPPAAAADAGGAGQRDRGPGGRPVSAEAAARDALAADPMPTTGRAAAMPGPVSTRDPGVIVLPRAAGTGPADVPTGFPRTPQGALAQLAAIDVTAMQTGSVDGVREVIDGWAAAAGPTGDSWSGVQGMASLLTAAGLSGAGSPQLAIVVRPAMGLIKGTVGSDFAVVCLDLEFTVTLAQTARVAIADCQRMEWDGQRWAIGPGPEPAPGPSVWPGTDLATDVGYRDLRHV